MKQTSFFKPTEKFYGGSLIQGKRKTARPLSPSKPLHLVLKSTNRVILRKYNKIILSYLKKYSARFGLKVYSLSVQKDHIHLLLKLGDREAYIKFIRSLTGVLAKLFGKGLWKFLPFSRIINWGRDFKAVIKYLLQNELEVTGQIVYQKRRDYYQRYRTQNSS